MNALALLLAALASGGDDDKTPARPAGNDQPVMVEIRCRSQALVRGVDVRLQDVAEITTDDPAVARRLADVTFGRRPAKGFNRVLPQSGVRSQLALEGLTPEQVHIVGADETIVQSVHASVQPQELVDIAEPILRAALELEPEKDIEFELTAKPSPLEVPPGRRSFDLRGRLRGNAVQPTSAMVEVAVMVDDTEFKVVTLPYRLRRFGKALVVTEPVRRETPLGPHMLETRRIELSPGAQTMHVDDFAAVQNMVAARDLRRGQTLRLADLAAPAVIRPKDPVIVVINRGRVHVTTRGVALAAGAVGERVAVVVSNGRVLQAQVCGAGVVALAEVSR
ncbi:MAG: flagellar basal body P-ring formation chaperone FlgA [Planctomycetota bacterium]